MRRTAGSALIAVLWCLALLAILTIGMLHTTRLELRLVRNHGDLLQAHYLALAGIEKAKALIHQETEDLQMSGAVWRSNLIDNPQLFRDVPLGRGLFRVTRPARREEGGQSPMYGLCDEESRLDLNAASLDELKRLPGMTPEIAAAIADWRDKDDRLTPGGAEAEYYASLSPPYRPRNGPFETLRELMMVRGVTPPLLFGEEAGREPSGAGGDGLSQAGASSWRADRGWSDLLTVESSVENVNARGKSRVNVKTASEESLGSVDGITSDLAKAIVAYRGQHELENVGKLLDVVEIRQNQPGAPPPPPQEAQAAPASGGSRGPRGAPAPPVDGFAPSGGAPAASGGAAQLPPQAGGQASSGVTEGTTKLVSQDLLKRIADEVTTDSGTEKAGLVNINSAPAAVLACLNGMSEELADAIVRHRQSNGPFANIAGLLEVSGVTEDVFKSVCPRIAARPGTYRVISEGRVAATGARKRIEAVIRPDAFGFETLSYREEP
jgi:competence ComEA-like helix-hairpin-helix protein